MVSIIPKWIDFQGVPNGACSICLFDLVDKVSVYHDDENGKRHPFHRECVQDAIAHLPFGGLESYSERKFPCPNCRVKTSMCGIFDEKDYVQKKRSLLQKEIFKIGRNALISGLGALGIGILASATTVISLRKMGLRNNIDAAAYMATVFALDGISQGIFRRSGGDGIVTTAARVASFALTQTNVGFAIVSNFRYKLKNFGFDVVGLEIAKARMRGRIYSPCLLAILHTVKRITGIGLGLKWEEYSESVVGTISYLNEIRCMGIRGALIEAGAVSGMSAGLGAVGHIMGGVAKKFGCPEDVFSKGMCFAFLSTYITGSFFHLPIPGMIAIAGISAAYMSGMDTFVESPLISYRS